MLRDLAVRKLASADGAPSEVELTIHRTKHVTYTDGGGIARRYFRKMRSEELLEPIAATLESVYRQSRPT